MPKQGSNHPWKNKKKSFTDNFTKPIQVCKNCGHTKTWHSPMKCFGYCGLSASTAEPNRCDCEKFEEGIT